MKRKPTKAPPAPAQPPPPERERYVPKWSHDYYGSTQHTTFSLGTLVEEVQSGRFRLPRFQRGWVWTDDQVIRLFDSLIRGFHVGSLLLWEQYDLPPSVERFGEVEVTSAGMTYPYLVVDGQQRIGSLMRAALSGRFWFDLEEGVLVTSPGVLRAPAGQFLVRHGTADNLKWPEKHAAEHGLPSEHVWDAWVTMMDVFSRTYISAVKIGHEWGLDRVMESFRRLNVEGTKMDLGELEAALKMAREL